MKSTSISRFLDALAHSELRNVFNPYKDRCDKCDKGDAPGNRLAVLERLIFRAAREPVDAIWIARDLGYRGGRRTGLALTDDFHYSTHLARWSIAPPFHLTGDHLVKERTATIVWEELNQIEDSIFLWNVFPFHPHEPDNCFSNRPHTRSERLVGLGFLSLLLEILRPSRIVAVGRDAQEAVGGLCNVNQVDSVRHPSYGGAAIFRKQIRYIHQPQAHNDTANAVYSKGQVLSGS